MANGPVAQLVRAPACHAGGRRFEPVLGRHDALVAQSVEQQTENLPVGGSIPPQGTTTNFIFVKIKFVVILRVLRETPCYRWFARTSKNSKLQFLYKVCCERSSCEKRKIPSQVKIKFVVILRVLRETPYYRWFARMRYKFLGTTPNAGVAQLAEQLICNQQVVGSSPITGSKKISYKWADSRAAKWIRL